MHSFPISVYYEDTDMAGIVYHANYLKFIERARSDWVAAMGVDQTALREAGQVFVVRRIEADYLGSAHFQENLEVRTLTKTVTGARLILDQQVWRGKDLLFQAEVTVVCATTDGQPTRLPAELRQKLH